MRQFHVHFVPALAPPEAFAGSIVVVVDVLRATTTVVHALAAGAREVAAAETVEEARALASRLPPGEALLAGERGGLRIEGFDLGNSPAEFTPARCEGKSIVLTTTNGTRAVRHARRARRVLLGAFVNFSAVCFELAEADGDVHVLCAGTDGAVALEDALFAGALAATLADRGGFVLDDAARIAWDAFEGHGSVLASAFELSAGGRNLAAVGLASDLFCAARIDRFGLVPEASGDPMRITVGAQHWGERALRR
jgi:2-phosphosulfolactate phosphatase